jgi:hypothetical protein
MRLALASMIVGVLATVSHAEPLEWQKDSSPKELTIAAAQRFCKGLGAGWRLPNRVELASLLADPAAEDGRLAANASALPSEGYLWSGEEVSASRKGEMWIMNLRNGHIFNGSGHTGYAKCVKGKPTEPPEVTLGAPVTSIGRADAKVVAIVAMQPDRSWFKVRPLVDKLAATLSVRFEVHFYLTDIETYLPDSLALCAAANDGKFDELEKELASSRPDPKWLDVKPDVLRTCLARVDRDQKFLSQRDIRGLPAFRIGKETIVGAQPIEKFEAAIKAAGG